MTKRYFCFITMRKILFILFMLFSYLSPELASAEGDNKPLLRYYERRLSAVGFDLVECKGEEIRDSCLHLFNALLDTAMNLEGSWDFKFDSVANLAKVYAPDKAFRIFTWTYRFDNDSFLKFGLIQFPEGEREESLVYLRDSSFTFGERYPVHKNLDPENWYGALYYDIVLTKKRRQRYYTLIGYDPASNSSNKKVLDVLWIDKKDRIIFGAPIFKMYSNRSPQKRVIWEYSNAASMPVRHEPRKNIITFENVIPPDKRAKGIYSLYLPDGTYDYFILKRGIWIKNEMLFDNVRKPTSD